MLRRWLYVVKPSESCFYNTEIFRVANLSSDKEKKVSQDTEIYLRHLRLGHINLDETNRLTKNGYLRELRGGTLPVTVIIP